MSQKPERLEIRIDIVPRAAKNRIERIGPDHFKVWTTSPPVDGEANNSLIELLCKWFHFKKTSISIIFGHRGRKKRIAIEDYSWTEFEERVSAHLDCK